MDLRASTPAEALLREHLARAGRLTFAQFMELALYDPSVGYYATQTVLGAEGDYLTSPELHPAFGALLGRQLEDCWRALGCPADFRVREVGGGSGALCRDVLLWARAAAPDFGASLSYEIVERSPALVARQRQTLQQAGLGAARVEWVDSLVAGMSNGAGTPEQPDKPGTTSPRPCSAAPITGCVVSNELLDSFPVHLVTMRQGRLLERYVVLGPSGLQLADDEPSTSELEQYFAALGVWPAEGCQAEVNLEATRWMARAAAWLERGLMLTLDYGYPAHQLYSRARKHGTLLCYYRHTLNSQPLERIGRQDITSHVDFTTLAMIAERQGLGTLGLVSQARALANLGLPAYLERLDRLPLQEQQANRRALAALVDPEGLGRIGLLVHQRGLADYLPLALRPDAPPPSEAYLPRLGPGALRLPSPEDLDMPSDFLAMWCEFLSGDEGLDD